MELIVSAPYIIGFVSYTIILIKKHDLWKNILLFKKYTHFKSNFIVLINQVSMKMHKSYCYLMIKKIFNKVNNCSCDKNFRGNYGKTF